MRKLAGILLFAVMPAGQGLAQTALPNPSASVTACPPAVADIATCYSDKDPNGAYILAAMPKQWNGNLVVYAHGGPSVIPYAADSNKSDLNKYAISVKLGFAWVASTYRREGYGVRMAATDTDNARKYFVERIAQPRRTVLHGASYGGIVGAKLVEIYGKTIDGKTIYDGAFLNSGLVGGPLKGYDFRVDLRAVYQHYCQNLPHPDEPQYPLWMGLAQDQKISLPGLEKLINDCTGVSRPAAERTAEQKARLANIVNVVNIPENLLFRHMQSSTLLFAGIVRDMTKGRNPFSNTGVVYKGSNDDAALNRDVARFAADPSAVADLRHDGEVTGNIPVPVISIHSINDPQVAVEHQSVYRDAAAKGGSGERLVQAYTDEPEHTGQSAPEIAASINALMQWIEKGQKPSAVSIAADCKTLSATLTGPCRYQPDFQPKPIETRFYQRTR